MQITSTLRKVTELCVAISAITVLFLSGCGGGSGTAGTGGANVTSLTITPFKGPFSSGRVVLRDANAGLVTIRSGETLNASGVANITFDSNVIYPLLVEVTGNYYNENTGLVESAAVPLRGLITGASAFSAGSAVPVTIITETAVAELQNRLGIFSASSSISAASAVVALQNAGYMFGISASAVPVFDPVTNESSDPDTLRLAALAVVAGNQTSGTTLAEKVKELARKMATLDPASAPTEVITQADFDSALTVVTGGQLRMMAAGTTTPTSSNIGPISMGNINTLCQLSRKSGDLQPNTQAAVLTGVNAVMGNLNVENVSGVPASSPLIYGSLISLSGVTLVIDPGSTVYVGGNTTVGSLVGYVPSEALVFNPNSLSLVTTLSGGLSLNGNAGSVGGLVYTAANYAVGAVNTAYVITPRTLGLAGTTTMASSVALTGTLANYAVGAAATILATDPALSASGNFIANNTTLTLGNLGASGVLSTVFTTAEITPATFPSSGLNGVIANSGVIVATGIPFICPQ